MRTLLLTTSLLFAVACVEDDAPVSQDSAEQMTGTKTKLKKTTPISVRGTCSRPPCFEPSKVRGPSGDPNQCDPTADTCRSGTPWPLPSRSFTDLEIITGIDLAFANSAGNLDRAALTEDDSFLSGSVTGLAGAEPGATIVGVAFYENDPVRERWGWSTPPDSLIIELSNGTFYKNDAGRDADNEFEFEGRSRF